MPTRYPSYSKNKYPSIEAYLAATEDKKEVRKLADEVYNLRSLCSRYAKEKTLPIIHPDEAKIELLWIDYRECTEEPQTLAPAARNYIKEHREILERLYPPSTTSFLVYWYEVWNWAHLEYDMPVEDPDYMWFFTLKQEGIPFLPEDTYYYKVLKCWFTIRSKEVRKILLKDLMKDPAFLERCRTGDFMPPKGTFPLEARNIFHAYTNYLLREMDETETRRYKEIDKLVKKEGLSPHEAFSQVSLPT